jgi:hypothetical protein
MGIPDIPRGNLDPGADCRPVRAEEPTQNRVDTLGASAIKKLQFTVSGETFSVGQNFTPSDPWPRVAVKRHGAHQL